MGYGNLEMCQKIQQHVLWFCLGVHRKTPLLALEGDKMSTLRRKAHVILENYKPVIIIYGKINGKNNLPNKPKLRTYISFKEKHCTKDYVKMFIHRKERSMLALIRFGIL